MKRNLLIMICLFFVTSLFSQAPEINNIKLNFSGFIKNDFFWDTRQTVSAREGHFLLFPSPVDKDPDGNDINAVPNFNFLSIQSRVTLTATGAKAFKANVTGKLEGAFFGQINSNINGFRLRLAYVNMDWGNTELRFGQDWIPMFITDCFPGTVSFNTGTPLQPFGRNPQIRLTQKFGKIKLIGVVSSQRDFANYGPNGSTGTYLRDAGLPEFSAQIHYKTADENAGTSLVTGIGAGYKTIVPQLKTGNGYKTDASVSGMNSIVFLKYVAKKITFKIEGIYGENITDQLSIGGFLISDSVDFLKGFVEYSPISTVSAWTDIHTNGKNFQVGLFAGYTQNLGAKNNMVGPVYGLGTNIANLYRVSPRLIFNSGKARFALEFEYTVAEYGSSRDAKGVPIDLTKAANLRTLFAVYYFF
ncbi:MAG: hypothetical protein H8E34_03300 [Bacteroidetes bacterium]|nr:hypothetical protein [Bacteroidota bacterium]MBL6942962.1 hypothetical protein [Bacteroidales bacterium]